MTWTNRIVATMVGMSIVGLFSLLYPALALIEVDPSTPTEPISPDLKNIRIQLKIRAFQKVISEDPTTGARQYVYLPLTKSAKVQRGSILRYTIVAKNGNRPVKNLILTQLIPKGTAYVLNSAKTDINGELLFSIDGGKTYTAAPMIEDRLVNPSAYTHLQWRFNGVIPSESKLQGAYEVEVK